MISNAHEAGAYDAAVLDTGGTAIASILRCPRPQELVRYATLAANSHNTQPWRFRLSDRSISVTPDLGRRLTTVDPDNHHLFATLAARPKTSFRRPRLSGFAPPRASTPPPAA